MNWTCHADRNLPLDTDTAWDGAAANKAMLDAANIGGDNPDFERARRGFLLVDDSAKELRGSYSLPFATLKGGTLTALISGCRAAASRLPQKSDVSSDEENKARAVLDAYFAKANKGKKDAAQPESAGGDFSFPVRLLTLEERATQPGSSDPELLTLLRSRASDPSIFDEFPPVFFTGTASTGSLDSFYTRMHGSSLKNFASDMQDGISLQDSHQTNRLGIGYSLRGQYVGPGGNGMQRAVGDFYSAPLDDASTAFIRKQRAGMVRDLSAGFALGTDGSYVCDLCNQPMAGAGASYSRQSCPHWPGMTYEVDNKPQLATATIHNAHLAEVSAVYDGATPGAMISRARHLSEAGLLLPETASLLEVQYRMKLPASAHRWSGWSEPRKEEPMGDETPGAAGRDEQILALRRALGMDEPTDDPLARAIELAPQLRELADLRPLKDEVERLRPLADDGRAYRSALIDETLEALVSAEGVEYPVEIERAQLAERPLEEIRKKRDFYRNKALLLHPGGRLTHERAPAPDAPPEPSISPSAYRA